MRLSIYYVMKVSFIALDIIREFYRTVFWDGWREKKCQLGFLLGAIHLVKEESLVTQSPRFEMGAGSSGYDEAGYIWGFKCSYSVVFGTLCTAALQRTW